MLDFPNNPVQGDIHSENGETWVYDQGAWVTGASSSGTVTEIVESGIPGGNWQVWGDVLIQWGTESNVSAGPRTVTFPQPFGSAPQVMAIPRNTGTPPANVGWTAFINSVTTTTCELIPRGLTTSGPVTNSITVGWIAVGEAPDELKKAKEVLGGAGTPSPVMEYHDPTSVASWRIVGSTLECWGYVTGDANGDATITFPKTFARTPITLVSTRTGSAVAELTGTQSATQSDVLRFNPTNQVGQPGTVHWHAIGEWDGIS